MSIGAAIRQRFGELWLTEDKVDKIFRDLMPDWQTSSTQLLLQGCKRKEGTINLCALVDDILSSSSLSSDSSAVPHVLAVQDSSIVVADTSLTCGKVTAAAQKNTPILSQEAEAKLRSYYDQCDKNSDGKINKRELILACRKSHELAEFFNLPQNIRQEDGSRDQMEAFFQQIDSNDDREMTWDEMKTFFVNVKKLAATGCVGGGAPGNSVAAEIQDVPGALADAPQQAMLAN